MRSPMPFRPRACAAAARASRCCPSPAPRSRSRAARAARALALRRADSPSVIRHHPGRWGSGSGPRPQETLFGHPVGLYTLFFAEMWERFSYYGMRALLIFYMIKGFLGMNDGRAYAVYGAYTALVYATPFLGGMLADRLLGARRAVVWGGLLMAAGHALMTVERAWAFYAALALLICGNGFFKPNISTIVGDALSAGRPAPRRRLHALLHGHQPRRRALAARVRLRRRDLRLALRLRPRDARHAHGRGGVRGARADHAGR